MYDKFQETVQFKNGRYEVALPWKDSHPILYDNHQLSLSRLNGLLRRLQQDKDILREYDSVIKGQIQQGIIETVKQPDQTVADQIHYLPYHAVVRKDKDTTKFIQPNLVSNRVNEIRSLVPPECWKLSAGLLEAPTISIPRCCTQQADCGFCDASLGAYAAVVYLLVETEKKHAVRFLAAKTRVSPLRKQTIPRLELLSALLLSRFVTSISQSLENELQLSAPLLDTRCRQRLETLCAEPGK